MTAGRAHESAVFASEAAGEVGGLFARHGRMVYGICRAMLRDVHEAEDATQQVFLSAFTALRGGARVRDPGGWLATIARNECRARIAAGMRRPLPVTDEDLQAIPATDDEHARQRQREAIRAALVDLPERQREAVVLRYLYGLRYGEVATALGLSRPATEALLFRARRALRTSLRPVAGAAIAVPVAVREQLALALPGFEERAAPMVIGAGVAGGVLSKLAVGGTGVKVATATAAVVSVGAVGTVGIDRPAAPGAHAVLERHGDGDGSGSMSQSGPSGAESSRNDDEPSDRDRVANEPSRAGDVGRPRPAVRSGADAKQGADDEDRFGSRELRDAAEDDRDAGSSGDEVETVEAEGSSPESGSGSGGSSEDASESRGSGSRDDDLDGAEPDEADDSGGPGSSDDREAGRGEESGED